jgi:hypothetical protein
MPASTKITVSLDPSLKQSWVDTHAIVWKKCGDNIVVYTNTEAMCRAEMETRKKTADYIIASLKELDIKPNKR